MIDDLSRWLIRDRAARATRRWPSPPRCAGRTLHVDKVAVTDGDVDDEIETLRDMYASWEPVERGAQQGDRVVLDVLTTFDGLADPTGQAADFPYIVGSRLIPEVDDAVLDLGAGQHTQTAILVAERTADVHLQVRDVRVKTLPEVDDDFAVKVAGRVTSEPVDTVEDLRAAVRAALVRQARKQQVEQAVEALATYVFAGLPADAKTRWAIRQQAKLLQGSNPVRAAERAELSLEEYMRRRFEDATLQVRLPQLLSDVALAEDIHPTLEEVQRELGRAARADGVTVETATADALRSAKIAEYAEAPRRRRAAKLLLNRCDVVDRQGEPVELDLSALA